jgi:hypothetical protein
MCYYLRLNYAQELEAIKIEMAQMKSQVLAAISQWLIAVLQALSQGGGPGGPPGPGLHSKKGLKGASHFVKKIAKCFY